jgi:hypothetical protein
MRLRNKKGEGLSTPGVLGAILLILVLVAGLLMIIIPNLKKGKEMGNYIFTAVNAWNRNCDYDHDGIVNPEDNCKCDPDDDTASRIYAVKGSKGDECPVYQRLSAAGMNFYQEDIRYLDGQRDTPPVEPEEDKMYIYVADDLANKKDCVKLLRDLALGNSQINLANTQICQYPDPEQLGQFYRGGDLVGHRFVNYLALNEFANSQTNYENAETNWILVLPQTCAERMLSLKDDEADTADARLYFKCKTEDRVCDGKLPEEKC